MAFQSLQKMNYLEFEEPIRQLRDQLASTRELEKENGVDMSSTKADLESKIVELTEKIYGGLTPWQRVQVSRHPDRPYTLDYIKAMTKGEFMELHGDRTVGDDKAMVGGWGFVDDQPVMFIGQQKGINTKMRQYRNFGMANPEGYRKAYRLMKLAEKFGIPVVTLLDTPGAYPGLEAEQRGQAEAIAKNLKMMATLKVPIVTIVIGEGASGGAIGIGMGNEIYMMENTWYSVISPESCSSILWKTWDYKEQAAEALKPTAKDLLELDIIDGIIEEPLGGAHRDMDAAAAALKTTIVKSLDRLLKLDAPELVSQRIEKYASMGVWAQG